MLTKIENFVDNATSLWIAKQYTINTVLYALSCLVVWGSLPSYLAARELSWPLILWVITIFCGAALIVVIITLFFLAVVLALFGFHELASKIRNEWS